MDNATWFAFFKPSNRPLLQDMIDLETSGISLEIPFARQIKVGFMIHCGDNLESHSLGGFKTSFSGGYICRVCHIHHKEIKKRHMTGQKMVLTNIGVVRNLTGTNKEYMYIV